MFQLFGVWFVFVCFLSKKSPPTRVSKGLLQLFSSRSFIISSCRHEFFLRYFYVWYQLMYCHGLLFSMYLFSVPARVVENIVLSLLSLLIIIITLSRRAFFWILCLVSSTYMLYSVPVPYSLDYHSCAVSPENNFYKISNCSSKCLGIMGLER